MMEEYTVGEEQFYLEPQAETTQVAELEVHKEAQNSAQKERKKERRKELKKVELSKRRKQKTTKLSFQMKLTPSRKRI